VPTKYELVITATGECRDAEGRLLDSDGNVIETNDEVDTDQESEKS
jgi:hypothetical protein